MITVNGKAVTISKFPNGETNIKMPDNFYPEGNLVYINVKFESDEDLIHLMFVRKHLINQVCSLRINYFPYSRMDRTENGSVFTLKYVADFINSLNFNYVYIKEAHSDVTLALVNNVINTNETQRLWDIIKNQEDIYTPSSYIFFPDAGAEKRYAKQIKHPFTLTGNKNRDWDTGNITGLTIAGGHLTGQTVFILDDLCSKGGTFMMSAKELRKKGAGDIYLIVTHCENTIYGGDIFKTDLIKKVFTTDSILSGDKESNLERSNGRLVVIK